MSEWKKYKLEEIATRITSGGTPSTRKSEYYGGNIPWLRTQEVNFNRIYDTEIKITDEAVKNSSAKIIAENSIIVAMYGATAGRIAINKIPLTTNQACCNITIDSKKSDYNFIYYYMKSKFGEILNMATGAAQQNLNAGMLRDFEIQAPDLATQRQIAAILSSLDDKIELNLQMNQTLEAMAQAIFKEWFVDFNYPKCLNCDSFDLSDEQDLKKESPKNQGNQENPKNHSSDNLPKGWRIKKLATICTVRYGKDHKHLEDGDIPVYGSGGIMRYAERALYENESILIPRKGTLSNLFYVTQPFWSVDTMFYTIINEISIRKYLFYLLKSLNLASMNVGSAVPSLTTEVLNKIDIVVPNIELLQEFENIVSTFYQKMDENNRQIQSLTQTRDALLPKLMSGSLNLDSFDLSDESDSEEKSTKSFNHKNQSADK